MIRSASATPARRAADEDSESLLPLGTDDAEESDPGYRFEQSSLEHTARTFERKVHRAQEQLVQLRHQQETIERQKQELEALSRKQDRFLSGRTELAEKLHRAVVMLQREANEARQREEIFIRTEESLRGHLESIESLNPEQWSRSNLQTELNQALAAIDDAEEDYAGAAARLRALGFGFPSAGSNAGASAAAGAGLPVSGRDFASWIKAGFAFTLPLMLFLAALLLFWAMFSLG